MRRARMPWPGPVARNAGAGSGEPICAENRPRRLSLGYTRTRIVKPPKYDHLAQLPGPLRPGSRVARDGRAASGPRREPHDPRRDHRESGYDGPRGAVAELGQERAEEHRAGRRAHVDPGLADPARAARRLAVAVHDREV